MTCDQTQPLLEAFAGGELGWRTAWRVRRHLAGCAACAAQLAEIRQLDHRVRAWRDVPAPAGLGDRIAAALPSAPPAWNVPPRRTLTTRRAAVGLAGVVAAAAAFFWLLPGQPGRPTIAFADVEQAMQQVQTASYDVNTQVYDAEGRIFPGATAHSLHIWLRRSPAAAAYFDRIMSERHLEDRRGGLDYGLKKGLYLKYPLKLNIAQQVDKQLRQLTEPTTSEAEPSPGPYQQWTMTPWQQQKVMLNGTSCLKFTRTVLRTLGQRHGVTHINIWVDAKTLRVTHIEGFGDAIWMAEGYQERAVLDNFHYNETPPTGVFDWSPPPGAKVQNMGPLKIGSHARARE